MPIELKMPALSPTMEEGTLAKWLVKEGDEVKSGDILAEIETDKATMEFEAVDEGKITRIVVPEGTDEVKVGAVIAIMPADGEDASASAPAAPAAESAPAPSGDKAVEQPSDQKTEVHSDVTPHQMETAGRAPVAWVAHTSDEPALRAGRRTARHTVREALRDAMAEEM